MEDKYNENNLKHFFLSDSCSKNIQKRLLKLFKSTEGQAIADFVGCAVSIEYPLTGLLIVAAKNIAGIADEIRIDALIKGLSTKLDQEKQINQLYGYIESSEENAFYVANSLRKALLSDSPIACAIMGRMLAEHIESKTSYDQEDKIIFHALENATDDDILMFYDFMDEYNSITDKQNNIPCELLNKYSVIENWCAFNRIIRHDMYTYVHGEAEINETFCITTVSNKLMDYIESIRQLLNRGKSRF